MFARAPNQPLEPPRRRVAEVLRAEVLTEALGLNPLENGEEETSSKEEKKEGLFQGKRKKEPSFLRARHEVDAGRF